MGTHEGGNNGGITVTRQQIEQRIA